MFWKTAIIVCELFNWKVILPIHRNFIDTFKKVSHLLHWLLDLRSFYKKLHVVHEHCMLQSYVFVIYGLKTNCSQYAQENPQYLPMNLFNQLSKSRAILMLWLFIYITRYQVIHKLLAKKYSVRIYPSSNEAKKKLNCET